MPLVSRTRATLRSAEFGFLGVTVNTRVQTPRFCGAPRSAGVFAFDDLGVRPLRTIWLMVGTSAFHEHTYVPRTAGRGTVAQIRPDPAHERLRVRGQRGQGQRGVRAEADRAPDVHPDVVAHGQGE